jgi:uncharacterized membrane protein YdjX (TVP38/TMEM64 family)
MAHKAWLLCTLTDYRHRGIAIFAAAIALSGMPPVPGYGMLTLFCGYVWGTWLGFVPAALGAFTGAMVSFIVLRRYLTGYCERVFLENPKVALVVRSVEGKGLKVSGMLWSLNIQRLYGSVYLAALGDSSRTLSI